MLLREQPAQERNNRQESLPERDFLDRLALGHAELATQLAPREFQEVSSRSARVWLH